MKKKTEQVDQVSFIGGGGVDIWKILQGMFGPPTIYVRPAEEERDPCDSEGEP